MTEVVLNEVRKGFYLDSVALMRLSREIAAAPGIIDAALMMGTPANMAILKTAGLLEDQTSARAQGNDLILAVRAQSEASARGAIVQAERALDKPKSQTTSTQAWRPRTIAAAIKGQDEFNLALISVPGDFAAAEARKALRRGLHVLMFSDNVDIDDERALKQEAQERDLLLMGPDCGTAIINGTPLAFANKVSSGSIGLIGASGTGIQEVSSLVSEAGQGISHAIGVGGRDLKKEVGGITTLMAMDALDADPMTTKIILISKPPHPDVAEKITQRIAKSPKPYVVCFVGAKEAELPPNGKFASTLKEAAEVALGGSINKEGFEPADFPAKYTPQPSGKRIEGLYAGGTLCAEAQVILTKAGRKIASNAPIPGINHTDEEGVSDRERIIDLGSDEYTKGRPHPMIDPSVRDAALRAALANSQLGVVLVDVVIGYGAHADPASSLVQVVEDRGPDAPAIVASVCGTELDPQVRSRQIKILQDAGIFVAPSNADACLLALSIVPRG
ncbi:MAG: acyl-CoA synthetase FdrA [Hyphomicrobiaceae bacterium]